ncbi:MAG: sigma factor [Singulisphaera sp.]
MANRGGAVLRHMHALFNVGTVAGLTDGDLLERFTTRGSEAAELAFAALVERHGPMVLRVCRRILSDPDDAQDAFQATFLVLVRRARSIRKRAIRGELALRSPPRLLVAPGRPRPAGGRSSGGTPRRRHNLWSSRRRTRAGAPRGDGPTPGVVPAPLVLCYLEGLSHEQAACNWGGRSARSRAGWRGGVSDCKAIDPPRPGPRQGWRGTFRGTASAAISPALVDRRSGARGDSRQDGRPPGSSRRRRPISCKEAEENAHDHVQESLGGRGRVRNPRGRRGSPRATVDGSPVPLPPVNAPEQAGPMITYEVRILNMKGIDWRGPSRIASSESPARPHHGLDDR